MGLLSLAGAVCLAPLFSNHTSVWTDHDAKVFTRALFRCEEKFPESPCLNVFMKSGEASFRVQCKDPFYFTKHPPRAPAFSGERFPVYWWNARRKR